MVGLPLLAVSLRKLEQVPFGFWMEGSLKLAAIQLQRDTLCVDLSMQVFLWPADHFLQVFLWLQVYKIKVY